MPVKIVDNNSASSIKDGTIQIGDLQNITYEYREHIALTAIPPRNVIAKRHSFYFTKAQIVALLKHYENNSEATALEVAIGVQLPDSIIDCPQGPSVDNSNCITVVISMANQPYLKPYNEIEDYILINGYHSAISFNEVGICCPGSKPPPPNN